MLLWESIVYIRILFFNSNLSYAFFCRSGVETYFICSVLENAVFIHLLVKLLLWAQHTMLRPGNSSGNRKDYDIL